MASIPLLDQTIGALSAAEVRRARQWLACPLHNQREDCRALFDLRVGASPARETDRATEFARLYPTAPAYDAARHRQTEHQLLKRLEAYLSWESYRRSPYAADGFLMRAARQRGLDDLRQTRARRYRPGPDHSTDRLAYEYQLAAVRDEFALGDDRRGGADPAAAERTLDRYVLALRLRQLCLRLARERLLDDQPPAGVAVATALLDRAFEAEYAAAPLIRLYALVASLQTGYLPPAAAAGSGPVLTQLAGLLTRYADHLTDYDRRTLLLLAINSGLRRANAGAEEAAADTLALYRLGLDAGMLHDRGTMSVFTFNNVLGLSVHLGQTEFANDFLVRYQADLPARGGQEVLALGRARLALADGDDGAALRHLQRADFRDFIHHLTARVLQLKIYFRQQNYTLVQAHVSSTRKLLSRKRGSSYHVLNYRNIFALAGAVLRLPPADPAARAALRARIAVTEPCTEKAWLLSTLV